MKTEILDRMPVIRFTTTKRRSPRLPRGSRKESALERQSPLPSFVSYEEESEVISAGQGDLVFWRFATTKRRSPRIRRGERSALEQQQSALPTAVCYIEEPRVNSVPDFVFWRFDVECLLEQNSLEGFLKRLQQIQLLRFFERTCEVIAPRELIVDFILKCKVAWVSSGERQLTYSLQVVNMPGLRIELTRDLFAEILQLPVVRSGSGPLEYGTRLQATLPSSGFREKIEWLGEEYNGSVCNCANYNELIGADGFSNCPSCSSNSPESYWLTDEIKDPSVKDLFRFLGLWIHNTNDTSCLRRAAVSTLYEALSSQTGNPVWTQHLWTNFLWDLEKVKEHGEQNEPHECHFSTAGLISTIICTHVRRSPSWIPAFTAWESSAFSPVMKKCKMLLKQLRMSEGDAQDVVKEDFSVKDCTLLLKQLPISE